MQVDVRRAFLDLAFMAGAMYLNAGSYARLWSASSRGDAIPFAMVVFELRDFRFRRRRMNT
jgi:hypothetical protein